MSHFIVSEEERSLVMNDFNASHSSFFKKENVSIVLPQFNRPDLNTRFVDFWEKHHEEYTKQETYKLSNTPTESHFLFFSYADKIGTNKNLFSFLIYNQYLGPDPISSSHHKYQTSSFQDNISHSQIKQFYAENPRPNLEEYMEQFGSKSTYRFPNNSRFNYECVFILAPHHYHYFADLFPGNPTMMKHVPNMNLKSASIPTQLL